jgi:antitoxin (DNA-binding transcriptional repressor) of toxin-antitoxin stability system
MAAVGMREFRAGLARYIEAGVPVEVTRHGMVVGVFVPQEPARPFNPEAFRAAGERLDRAMSTQGVTSDELVREFEEARKASR